MSRPGVRLSTGHIRRWDRGVQDGLPGGPRSSHDIKGDSARSHRRKRTQAVTKPCRPRQTLGFRTPAEKLTELIDGLHTGAPGR
jgi:hypothetical protein